MQGYNLYYQGKRLNKLVLTPDEITNIKNTRYVQQVDPKEHVVTEIPVSKIRFIKCTVV